ncbi:penicillin-binding transpeptidase domain-containing protein [Paenibacillus sp. FSL W8-0186]|uniref:peptidoglycan D,D-transpeptidase FtsI family protein n=1 Tax=Paenibacillus sp. FSL W8-0186 TaxID=2921709 RepID=UPI0030CE2238
MTLLRKRRIFYILIGFMLMLLIYAVRMVWIQIASANKAISASGMTMNELAVRQREEGIELDPGRGQFLDRHGEPLTGKTVWVPVLFPLKHLPDTSQIHGVADLLGVTAAELEGKWSRLQYPFIWKSPEGQAPLVLAEHEAERWSQVSGFRILPYMQRYLEDKSGKQWLGYVSQRPDYIRSLYGQTNSRGLPLSLQVGASGLERTFDQFLRGVGSTRAAYTVDGQKRPISGLGMRLTTANDRYYPLSVRTTVDRTIQQHLEDLTEQMGIREGAIVVLDAAQGDVVAMVSRPFFNPRQIDLEQGSWSNHAVKAAVPGSIFKTVIAAAALEEGVASPGEKFHCTGHYGKYGLSCWKEGGHGMITLKEAFAQSCNIVFAELGERLTADSIGRTADKLGLGRMVGWQSPSFREGLALRQIDQEEAGVVFAKGGSPDGGTRAQTALGQRDVLVSPLQAANLVVTLLHDGKVAAPRLVQDIYFKNGVRMLELPPQSAPSKYGAISPATARILRGWMKEVVSHGTGQALQNAQWHLAGKSGTAQTVSAGRPANHQWFIGYGPAKQPRYAVAVLVENRSPGAPHQATELFRRVMDLLAARIHEI